MSSGKYKLFACYIFSFIMASNSDGLLAQGGTDKEKPEQQAGQRRVIRTNAFLQALNKITHCARVGGNILLDEMGALACSLNRLTLEDDSSFDSPLDVMETDPELPPDYAQVNDVPEDVIRNMIMSAHQRSLILGNAGCVSLIVEDIERTLDRFPSYQSKEFHSGLLYQILRTLHMTQERFQDALQTVKRELSNLPLPFIEENDPQAIVDYAEILQALGKSENAADFLESRVTEKSRLYIRRSAALWMARFNTERGNVAGAEAAYIEALIISRHDPETYLALVQFYFDHDNIELAAALTGVMNGVVTESEQWADYGENLKKHIESRLPRPLKNHQASEDDLKTAIKLWINQDKLEQTAYYWLPLMKSLSGNRSGFMLFGDNRKSLKKLILDLPLELSLSSEQRLQYYKILYRYHRAWIEGGFFKAAVLQAMLYSLDKEFSDPEQHLELALFAVAQDREEGLFEKGLADIGALEALINDYIAKNNMPQAIGAFIDLVRQHRWNTSSTLSDLMKELAPHMTNTQALQTLEGMFNNFYWARPSIPDMINSLVQAFNEKAVSEMVEQALTAESDAVSEYTAWNLTLFLNDPELDKAGLIFSALLSQPRIAAEWRAVSRKSIYQPRRDYPYITANRPGTRKNNTDSSSLSSTTLSQLLSSIGIQQQHVPADGLCMWHALSWGLNHYGVATVNGATLQHDISPLISQNDAYAPSHWGISDHLSVAAQMFNAHIMQINTPAPGLLSATFFQPSANGGTVETPLQGQNLILETLQNFHDQNTPVIIMISNIVETSEGLTLNHSDHWSAGYWSPSAPPEHFTAEVLNTPTVQFGHLYEPLFLPIKAMARE